MTYDTINEIITAYNNSELVLNDGYKLISSNILYNTKTKIISSNHNSKLTDLDGNSIIVDMFEYHLEKNLFSSLGNIKIVDTEKNKYFFKEIHIDTEKKEMIGSDISIVLDEQNFGVSEKSDPRFVANDILLENNQTVLSKGVFTVCQKKEGECPPWSIRAKRIVHNHVKKNIYYEHAVLKFYDVPIFYFPRFFHPDPTVKRQSGFLTPGLTNSTLLGYGVNVPYYFALADHKDATLNPKIYADEHPVIQTEYRHLTKNSFQINQKIY